MVRMVRQSQLFHWARVAVAPAGHFPTSPFVFTDMAHGVGLDCV